MPFCRGRCVALDSGACCHHQTLLCSSPHLQSCQEGCWHAGRLWQGGQRGHPAGQERAVLSDDVGQGEEGISLPGATHGHSAAIPTAITHTGPQARGWAAELCVGDAHEQDGRCSLAFASTLTLEGRLRLHCPPTEHPQCKYSRVGALTFAVCLCLQGTYCPPPKDRRASALLKVSPAPCLEARQSPDIEAALIPTPT